MADDKAIVKAQIEDVVSCVPTHKVSRDPEGEKRVKEDLKSAMKAEGLEPKEGDKDFQSRYRAKLRAYAAYKDGVYVDKDPNDGGPALMVPRKVFEYELKVRYSVEGKEYSNTINFDSDKNELKKDGSIYLTVNSKKPLVVSRKSVEDYRPEEKVEQGSCAGCFVILLILFMIAFGYLLRA